jgi:hypothetical protein
MAEWQKFRVGRLPSTSRFRNNECLCLDTVSHTSHVGPALQIIDSGQLRPQLVFDESRLNDKRILVAWLSPNYWHMGFRYGNIKFDFPFKEIIKGKRYYWVESIAYQISACRILITDIDRDGQLERYDPAGRDGPWWYDRLEDRHYYNNKHCLEFMLEAPLDLADLQSFGFVDHHKLYCAAHRKQPERCAERSLPASKGGALFLTRAAVSHTRLAGIIPHVVDGQGQPTAAVAQAVFEFSANFARDIQFGGKLHAQSPGALAVMRAVMSAFTFGALQEARLLGGMFADADSFANVAAMVLADTLGLGDWNALRAA